MDRGASGEEIDQFQLLEDKIDGLIDLVSTLKKENESLSEKLEAQEGKLADVTGRLQKSESSKDAAKQRVVALLNKIEHIGL